jgi:hypothetical protein
LGKLLPLQAHVTGNTGSAVTNVFIPSLDVMDAAERYARLLRGEDVGLWRPSEITDERRGAGPC